MTSPLILMNLPYKVQSSVNCGVVRYMGVLLLNCPIFSKWGERFGGASYTKIGGRFGACPAGLVAFGFAAPSVADMGAENRVYKKKWERNRSRFVTRKGFYVFCVTRKGCCYKLNAYNDILSYLLSYVKLLFHSLCRYTGAV